MYAFLHPALAQTRDYTRSIYTCIHFLSYDTPAVLHCMESGGRILEKRIQMSERESQNLAVYSLRFSEPVFVQRVAWKGLRQQT